VELRVEAGTDEAYTKSISDHSLDLSFSTGFGLCRR
jgi:hypothetical protein